MLMPFVDCRRFGRLATITLILAPSLGLAWMGQPVDAASSVQTLVAQAEHNTNTVRTIVHREQSIISASGVTVKVNAHGSEDEVRNREQDYESVTVTGKDSTGKVKSVHYTVDIIFMNGYTYYRTPLVQNNQWKKQKGMSFADPYTGGWQRGRTTVPMINSPKSQFKLNFQEVGVSGGETHVRSVASNASETGTVDMWISGGSTPYVVREVDSIRSTKKSSPGSVHVQSSLGPFNSTVVILPPTSQGTT